MDDDAMLRPDSGELTGPESVPSQAKSKVSQGV